MSQLATHIQTKVFFTSNNSYCRVGRIIEENFKYVQISQEVNSIRKNLGCGQNSNSLLIQEFLTCMHKVRWKRARPIKALILVIHAYQFSLFYFVTGNEACSNHSVALDRHRDELGCHLSIYRSIISCICPLSIIMALLDQKVALS